MERYEVELESAESQGFAVTVPALPGLLVFGATIDEVLARARASIAFHICNGEDGQVTDKIALARRTYARQRPQQSH